MNIQEPFTKQQYLIIFHIRFQRHGGRNAGAELMTYMKPDCEEWRVLCELNELETDAGILYQPFETLSCGERTQN